MKVIYRLRIWLSDLIYPGDRAIGNRGNGEPGSYKNARGCLADVEEDLFIRGWGMSEPKPISELSNVDDNGPENISIPIHTIKAAVDLIEDGVAGSYHGNVNGMPEHEWRVLYIGEIDSQ